jgi:hypothetical protein
MDTPVKEVREGFQLTSRTFSVPTDTTRLSSTTKRKITICNLFANHSQSIRDIARVLDESYGHVVQVLIECGMVYERRKNRQETVQVERRQTFFRTL